jgi:YHS domain-containing protein
MKEASQMPFWIRRKTKDPVCGMEIDPKKAANTTTYQGKTYYFCSLACHDNFAREPEKYAV